MIEDVLLDTEERMEKAVTVAADEFASIRTGRANPNMFNQIPVEYYGASTPLQQLASINIPQARTVLISPFDKTATGDIIRAIQESDLGVNPTDDGNVIRVNMPQLTEERRKDYVKLAGQKAEEGRVSLRGVRRKAMDELNRIKKDGEAGEDEVERAQKELESTTKSYISKIDKLLEAKEAELLEI
ncbi:MAG: ribosome recycling factor [Varibaculum sp.]|nr:ribosome recycling factor [Varibaculum sp.]